MIKELSTALTGVKHEQEYMQVSFTHANLVKNQKSYFWSFSGQRQNPPSYQWEHKQSCRHVVFLRGSGAGGDDPGTDLLSQEILRSETCCVEIVIEYFLIDINQTL